MLVDVYSLQEVVQSLLKPQKESRASLRSADWQGQEAVNMKDMVEGWKDMVEGRSGAKLVETAKGIACITQIRRLARPRGYMKDMVEGW